MADLRTAAQQALEALEAGLDVDPILAGEAEEALRAALAQEQAGPTGKQDLQVESVATVAENATTQQRVGDAPPSDYRRGYWDGFAIGKREGRIEAEDAALAQEQAEPWTPAALGSSLKLWFDPANPWASVQQQAEPSAGDALLVGFLAAAKEAGVTHLSPEVIKAIRAASAQEQAEPLNLSDRAVQRRLAAQWGYVPAQEQAKSAQEPVAYIHRQGNHWEVSERPLDSDEKDRGWTEEPLYTAPPRRTMVPLTEAEIDNICRQAHGGADPQEWSRNFARAIEKASWEKNHG